MQEGLLNQRHPNQPLPHPLKKSVTGIAKTVFAGELGQFYRVQEGLLNQRHPNQPLPHPLKKSVTGIAKTVSRATRCDAAYRVARGREKSPTRSVDWCRSTWSPTTLVSFIRMDDTEEEEEEEMVTAAVAVQRYEHLTPKDY